MQLNYSNYGILMRNQVQKLCKKNNKSASRKPRHEIQGLQMDGMGHREDAFYRGACGGKNWGNRASRCLTIPYF